jgi:hypothetical protein
MAIGISKQSQDFVSKVTISEKAQEASFLVAEFITQKRKSHTVGENLIMPACKIMWVKCWDKMQNKKFSTFK